MSVLVLETCFWCFKRSQCYRSSALDCSNRTATEEKEGDDLADQLDLDEGMDTHATPCEKQPSFPVPTNTQSHTVFSPSTVHPSFERVPSTNLSMAF